jgi:hypothetical protein
MSTAAYHALHVEAVELAKARERERQHNAQVRKVGIVSPASWRAASCVRVCVGGGPWGVRVTIFCVLLL